MPVATEIVWSPYQEEVFRFIESGAGSAIITAMAGSAKTTTLVEAASRLTEYDNAICISFNKRIADELTKRLPSYVPALTLNAMGHRCWARFTEKKVEVDGQKVTKLVREHVNDSNAEYRKGVKRLVDLAKTVGIVPTYVKPECTGLVEDTPDAWESLINEYGVGFGYGDNDNRAISDARRVLAESIRCAARVIDFNDQLYLPVVFNVDFLQYSIVFVDEAQDVSGIQQVMIERSLAPNGRLVAVGDPAQAIYGFRGAGKNAMHAMGEKFSATRLGLPVCYRCSRAVVAKAQQFVPEIQAWEGACEGLVDEDAQWTPGAFRATDVVLCRNNAPLVKFAFSLIRAGVACKVLGREIGSGLVAIVRKLKAETCAELKTKLSDWLRKEIVKAGDSDAQVQTAQDKFDTLHVFIENARTPEDVVVRIEALFADNITMMLTLATIHKSKGGEWERVWLLDPELIGARNGMTQEEKNLYYVAVTRSKVELRFIRSVTK